MLGGHLSDNQIFCKSGMILKMHSVPLILVNQQPPFLPFLAWLLNLFLWCCVRILNFRVDVFVADSEIYLVQSEIQYAFSIWENGNYNINMSVLPCKVVFDREDNAFTHRGHVDIRTLI